VIFHVEGTVFGINTNPRPLADLIKFRERRGGCARQGLPKDFQKGETIIDRTVAIVETSGLADQIAEFAALEAARGPFDFCDRTGLRLVDEDRQECLAEWTVEAGVVGDDEVGWLDQGV
jgi:hypothetical protein